MNDLPRFSEHDTTLSLWLDDPNDHRVTGMRNALIALLRRRGFRVRLDARIKRDYRLIRHDHHEGRKGDLQFKLERSGRVVRIEFYQDIVTKNSNGGRYDFDKLAEMPYLIRLRYFVERRHIAALFAEHGFPLQLEQRLIGRARIDASRAKDAAFHRGLFDRPPLDYNARMGDCDLARDEMVVWFVTWPTYRWERGIAFRGLNNVWSVLLPCGTVKCVASFDLFAAPPLAFCRCVPDRQAEQKLRALLAAAVKAERFERAAVLRDVIGARFPMKAAA